MEAFGTLTGYTSIISFLIQFYTLSDNSEPDLEDFIIGFIKAIIKMLQKLLRVIKSYKQKSNY